MRCGVNGRSARTLRRGCSRLALLVLVWSIAQRGAAASDIDAVASHLRGRGASDVTEVARGFVFEGHSIARSVTLAHAGCVAFLALGVGDVRDVDLGLYAHSGQLIAEDAGIAPVAYARVCGAAGLALYASATLYAGRGELVLLRVDDAPRELGRLPDGVALAVSAGGTLEEPRAVGAAGDELATETALLQDERAQVALGYVAAGLPLALELRAGSARGQLILREGACVRVSAMVPLTRGIAIELESPHGMRWASRSPSDDRVAVALCTPMGGAMSVRVQARAVRGMVLVRAFEHPDVDPLRARELGPASAFAVAEARTVAAARGFRLTLVGQGWVESTSALVWPLTLERGDCHALAVISEVGAPAVDIRLTDGDGNLIAHNEGRRGVPMVFFCAERAGPARLIMRARGPDLRVGVWLGQAKELPR